MRTDQDERTPYADLSPDLTLDALESAGFRADGGLTALNSFENRVFQVGIDEGEPVVAKFYRPGRWSSEAILEEHAFTRELAELELPCIAPLQRDGRTLFEYEASGSGSPCSPAKRAGRRTSRCQARWRSSDAPWAGCMRQAPCGPLRIAPP